MYTDRLSEEPDLVRGRGMSNPSLSTEFMTGDDQEPKLFLFLGEECRELTAEEALELAAHLTQRARQMLTNEKPAWMASP